VPGGESGKLQSRALFAYLKAVYQRYVQCDGSNRCHDIRNSPPSDFAEAVVDKFGTVQFRYMIIRKAKPHPPHHHSHR